MWFFPRYNCQVWKNGLDVVWEIKLTCFSSGALHPGLHDFLKEKMSIYLGWPCSGKRSTQKCSASSRNLGDDVGVSASLCWVRATLLSLNVICLKPACWPRTARVHSWFGVSWGLLRVIRGRAVTWTKRNKSHNYRMGQHRGKQWFYKGFFDHARQICGCCPSREGSCSPYA